MTLLTLLRRSLRFHWRAHLGVVLGAAVGSAALIGALIVGDSVRGSLRELADQRLGATQFAMVAGDRLFRAELADNFQRLYSETGFTGGDFVPVLQFTATVSRSDGAARANRVMLHGVDERWNRVGGEVLIGRSTNGVWLNHALASQLNVGVGETVLLRLPKPTALSAEAAISHRDDQSIAVRLPVAGIVGASQLGNFSLVAGSSASFNAFIPLRELQRVANVSGKANLLLVTGWQWEGTDRAPARLTNALGAAAKFQGPLPIELLNCPQELARAFTLEDLQLNLRSAPDGARELVTPRIFIDESVVQAARVVNTNSRSILTYLANQIRLGTNGTPYSMVAAADEPWTPPGLREDEIVINQWLADDLHARVGDLISLSYFRPESGAQLVEATNVFRVHSIVPLESPWLDRTLMPDFPGLEKAESTSEWDAGFPLTYEIRKKDDDYWRRHRGTPKAFINLSAGQKLWGNRFGSATAIRVSEAAATNLVSQLVATVNPLELGLRFEAVRERAQQGVAQSQDFGQLFLGFSVFLIAAALILMALLFRLGLEQRAVEVGTLLALGFSARQVRKLLLGEGAVLAFGGGLIGIAGGIGFARTMVRALETIWRDAIGATQVGFFVSGETLAIGVVASVVVAVVTIWAALRRFTKLTPRELLAGEIQPAEMGGESVRTMRIGLCAGGAAIGLVGWAALSGNAQNAGAFFGAGALVLVAGLCFLSAWLGRSGRTVRTSETFSLTSLAIRGCARRKKRSVATATMLACGAFLILSIGVFRLDAGRNAASKGSGTGGFALIGETTLPVVQDLNAEAGREFFALNGEVIADVNIVPLRVRAGDEASCLNLARAQKPRLVGVNPSLIHDRFDFVSRLNALTKLGPWFDLQRGSLSVPLAPDEVPAIGDANSIQWAMGKKVGDTLDYVDERGQSFKVRIVGSVANSILQGQLLIDEAEFLKRFPGEAGYRMFLIDAPSNRLTQVAADLSRAMQDVGIELTLATARLNHFNAVQNTYLGTFQILGALGLLLGSAGLGVVVLRNVLERRSELAVWIAVGFRRSQVQRIVLMENLALLVAGLLIGTLAAALSVLPAMLSPTMPLPAGSLAITVSAVMANGALWTWVATRYAVRGDLLRALRND